MNSCRITIRNLSRNLSRLNLLTQKPVLRIAAIFVKEFDDAKYRSLIKTPVAQSKQIYRMAIATLPIGR